MRRPARPSRPRIPRGPGTAQRGPRPPGSRGAPRGRGSRGRRSGGTAAGGRAGGDPAASQPRPHLPPSTGRGGRGAAGPAAPGRAAAAGTGVARRSVAGAVRPGGVDPGGAQRPLPGHERADGGESPGHRHGGRTRSSRCAAAAPPRSSPPATGPATRTGSATRRIPGRVADRRDTYPGQQVTVFDNRGICQHSGYCTDRLPAVFRTDNDPFVAPSGGPDGRDHPGRRRLPVRRPVVCAGRPRGPRPRRLGWPAAAGDRDHRGRPVPGDRPDPARRARGGAGRARPGQLGRALCAVPVRALPQQAVLLGHALVRGVHRPATPPEPDAVRARRGARAAHPHRPAAVREAHPRRPAARPGVRGHAG